MLCVASRDKQATYRTIKTKNQVRMKCEQSAGEYKKKKPWWGRDFFAPIQTGCGAHLPSYAVGAGCFPGRGVNHPSPSSAEVKERVELCLYSPSGPSWPALGEGYVCLLLNAREWCFLRVTGYKTCRRLYLAVGFIFVYQKKQQCDVFHIQNNVWVFLKKQDEWRVCSLCETHS